MRLKVILYPVIVTMLIGVPALRYYASTPDINACVLDYVDNLEDSNYQWYMYDIDGVKHIEPLNSRNNESLEQYRVWTANGCLMSSDDFFTDMNNTFYCTVTYLIRKAPVDEKYKEPLWILKTE